MQSRNIPDRAISASSFLDNYHGPHQARLHLKKARKLIPAWSAKYNNQRQWISVDLGSLFTVTRIATQGRNDKDEWVKSYRLHYSQNGQHWTYYEENEGVHVSPHTLIVCI